MVKQLSEERAAQLYAFARFLLAEAQHAADTQHAIDEDDVSGADLAAEDAQWNTAMTRHADAFAALKAQALADIKAGNTSPMFDEHGTFDVE